MRRGGQSHERRAAGAPRGNIRVGRPARVKLVDADEGLQAVHDSHQQHGGRVVRHHDGHDSDEAHGGHGVDEEAPDERVLAHVAVREYAGVERGEAGHALDREEGGNGAQRVHSGVGDEQGAEGVREGHEVGVEVWHVSTGICIGCDLIYHIYTHIQLCRFQLRGKLPSSKKASINLTFSILIMTLIQKMPSSTMSSPK